MESRFGLGEVTPVGVPRQEQVVAVGRVCCESAEGKINRASIILEVCVRTVAQRSGSIVRWGAMGWDGVRCDVLWHGMVWCGAVRCDAV